MFTDRIGALSKKLCPTTSAQRQVDRFDTSRKRERNPSAVLMTPNVLMVFPRFNPHSFWNLQELCDIRGARCPAPPLGLITVAALLPPAWNIRLVNRNAEELSESDLVWADMVMTGGMLPQQPDTLALIDLCHAHGKPVVVGGPDATSSPDIYSGADFRVLGEAEGIIDQFVAAWSAGSKTGVFEAAKFQVDVSKSPMPRFDLLKREHYVYIGVQFSRGCPFNCEFCDIIELYGRVPRTKTNAQMLAELDTLYRIGHRGHVDFVDDNLIGNKKALKLFLPALERWQRERNYPFQFSTEASMNLADDAQLLQMMRNANFFAIFVGIESPDTATLISMQKKQNTRRSLAESVHKIYGAGMFVLAGFIIGFDAEKNSVAQGMVDCIEATSIPVCMVGLLTALPNTQLTRRLQKEGRLLPMSADNKGDQCTAGLNFVTLRPRRDVLADYRAVLKNIYQPDAYFERVRTVGRALNCPSHAQMFSFKELRRDLAVVFRLMWRMTVQRPELRRHFWRTFIDCARNNIGALEYVIQMMAFYLHLGTFAKFLINDLDRQIEIIDNDVSQSTFRRAHAMSA
jgi:radical SAM superfamily enzyme YgiQ (UPF0313 family)